MASSPVDSLFRPAAVKALESFAVEPAEIELVAHSENVTFRVAVQGSDIDYALRLHRPGYNSIEELESEREWTEALYDSGIPVQNSLQTRQGKHFTRVEIPATGEQRYAGMTTWLDGTPLSEYPGFCNSAEIRKRCLGRIGELAATMHKQSTRWDVPPGFTRPRLDLDALLGEAPRWGRFWEHSVLSRAEQSALLRARENIQIALVEYGERPDNFSLIHSDLHPDNIIHNGDALALIDFDDAAYGWHMYDIASVLFEFAAAPDFEALRAALLVAYQQHRSLAQRDIDMLSPFLLVRGMALIGWYHQRPEHTESGDFTAVKNWVMQECAAATP